MAGSSGSGGGGQQPTDPLLFGIGIFGIFVVFLLVFYHIKKYLVLSILLWIAYFLFLPFSMFPGPHELLYELTHTNIHKFDMQSVITVYTLGGEWIGRWILLLISGAFLVWAIRKGNLHAKYKRTYDINSLTQIMSEYYHCLRPLRFTNGWKEPMDEGPWESPRTPIQWVLHNQLLIDGTGAVVEYFDVMDARHFPKEKELYKDGKRHPTAGYVLQGAKIDQEKTIKVWEQQLTLGLPCDVDYKCSKFPSYARAIAAALLCYAHSSKDEAWSIFDDLNDVWTPTNPKFADSMQDRADKIFEKYKNTDITKDVWRKHGYWPATLMAGLMDAAHERGSLSTSEFIWLRKENIVLFEILNARGGGVEWANSSMVGCQVEHEFVLGSAIPEMMWKKAFIGLNRTMYEEGWIDNLPEGMSPKDQVRLN